MYLVNTKIRKNVALASCCVIAALSNACSGNVGTVQLRSITSEEKAMYALMAAKAAQEAGVPQEEFVRIIAHESGFKPWIRGAAGEYGLGQIKCTTARSVGFTGDCNGLLVAAANLKYSARYYAIARKKCGNFEDALYLYNAGTASDCAGRNEYVRKVSALQ